MTVKYKLISEVASEPISVAQAKISLRIPTTCTDDDALIGAYITAARQMIESRTNYKMGVATIDCIYERFYPEMWVEFGNVATVESVKYYSGATTQVTMPTTGYEVSINEFPALVRPIYGTTFPSTFSRFDAVTIQIKTSNAYPAPLVIALYMIIGHWYENRQDVIVGHSVNEIPQTSADLCEMYRLHVIR